MGSKYALSKQISEVIRGHVTNEGFHYDLYAEPFCGVCTVFKHLSLGYQSLINDSNESLIMLLQEIKDQVFENTIITKELWEHYKASPEPSALRCICQYGCSFNNFSSYVDDNGASFRTMIKLTPLLSEAIIFNFDYREFFNVLTGLRCDILLYCDPPYNGCETNGTSYGSKFDSLEFYEQVRKLPKNIKVYISDLEAPDDFECIWSQERKTRMNSRGTEERPCLTAKKKTIIEKIFTLKKVHG